MIDEGEIDSLKTNDGATVNPEDSPIDVIKDDDPNRHSTPRLKEKLSDDLQAMTMRPNLEHYDSTWSEGISMPHSIIS
jgi:hypothetical protein